MPFLRRQKWATHVPFLPTYTSIFQCKRNKLKQETSNENLESNDISKVLDASKASCKDASQQFNNYQNVTKL